MNNASKKKFAFCADTPLHIFNIINFVWNNIENSRNRGDLYVHKQFGDYDGLIHNLRNTGLFDNVYECSLPVKSDENKIEHHVKRLFELFTPRYQLKKWIKANVEVENKYDVLVMPAPLRFSLAMYDLNRGAEVIFIEDGTANYYDNILNLYGPKGKHLIKLLFNKGHEIICPSKVYVNNAPLAYKSSQWNTIQMPSFNFNNADFLRVITSVFGTIPKSYSKRVIYLLMPVNDIPLDDVDKAEVIIKSTLEPLMQYKEISAVKPHPRGGGMCVMDWNHLKILYYGNYIVLSI